MSKVAVVFWSATGNTETMANCVAEGAKGTIVPCSEMNAAKLAEFDAVAFGCPAMGAEQLEESEFEPMFSDLEGSLNGKKIALFGSYGWGDGQWMRDWVERALQIREHRLKLALLQLLGTHCRAAKGDHIILAQLGGVHLAAGDDGGVGTCALCDAVCHGLGVAGLAPEYDCYFAHLNRPLSINLSLVYANFQLQKNAAGQCRRISRG